jgi:hypothetical protein
VVEIQVETFWVVMSCSGIASMPMFHCKAKEYVVIISVKTEQMKIIIHINI